MPEGPEARNQVDIIRHFLENKCLLSIDADYKHRNIKIDSLLLPRKIEKVYTHGKRIILKLEGDNFLGISLGMTGILTPQKGNYTRVTFKLGVSMAKIMLIYQLLFFEDMRGFGSLTHYRNINTLTSTLGIDPLQEDIKKEFWNSTFQKHKNKNITSFLMNQSIISGIGNYLKVEILYQCEISPKLKVGELSVERWQLLRLTIIDVCRRAYNSKGGNKYQYYNGEIGSFNCLVYNKQFDPLGNTVVKGKFADGRTTHWVVEIQK
jgi:endonuclease-8